MTGPRAAREPVFSPAAGPAPVFGCVLAGGRSRRMGRPKQLMTLEGETWLDRIVSALASRVETVAVAGAGPFPPDWPRDPSVVRLPDAPGFSGPAAGIAAALRWAPRASWIVCACDMPLVSPEAVDWLLGLRRPGRWMVMPIAGGRPQPLFAWYDCRALRVFEELAGPPGFKPTRLADHPKTALAVPPPHLESAWTNVNTPEDLAALPAEAGSTAARHPGCAPAA